jgi:hypothetical protein
MKSQCMKSQCMKSMKTTFDVWRLCVERRFTDDMSCAQFVEFVVG